MKWLKRLDKLSLTTFVFFAGAGIISHLLVFSREPLWDIRTIHKLSFGISYDIMNGAMLAIIALLAGTWFPIRPRKFVHALLFFLYLFFVFVDFNYVEQFGTHLPFSTLEYLEEASAFSSTIYSVFFSKNFWLIIVAPFVMYLVTQRVFFPVARFRNPALKSSFITIIALFLLGGISGSYPNSNVSKNLNDPLTASGLFYFYYSRHIEKEIVVAKPVEALAFLEDYIQRKGSIDPKFAGLPLVQVVTPTTCNHPEQQNAIGHSLCGNRRPNILLLMLESFRAVDVGAYGSKIKVTPQFDRLKNEGIFFENFFANGFQTRHGQVASYCSIFPNYGAAIMKRYNKNNYYCLPQLLKNQGYENSWIFASDAAFDDQIHFLPKIGFDKIYDRYAFSTDAEVLGWGYSDREMYSKWLEILGKEKEPFFSSALTITLHHPFDVPDQYKLDQGQSDLSKYFEAVYYTDAMLGEFIDKAKQTDWYENTLIFVLADTSNYQQPQSAPENFEAFVRLRSQIPLLILGGAVKKPVVVKAYYSQIDLPPTIMDLLGEKYTTHWAGSSMLSNQISPIAFTNRPGNYWAVMGQNGRYYNENNSQDHYFGFKNDALKSEYKLLGLSWIQLTKWMLQEDLYWKDE